VIYIIFSSDLLRATPVPFIHQFNINPTYIWMGINGTGYEFDTPPGIGLRRDIVTFKFGMSGTF
jgi:hypothetical protein